MGFSNLSHPRLTSSHSPPTDLLHLGGLPDWQPRHPHQKLGSPLSIFTSFRLPSPGNSHPSASPHLASPSAPHCNCCQPITELHPWLFHNNPLSALSEAPIGHPLVKAPTSRQRPNSLAWHPRPYKVQPQWSELINAVPSVRNTSHTGPPPPNSYLNLASSRQLSLTTSYSIPPYHHWVSLKASPFFTAHLKSHDILHWTPLVPCLISLILVSPPFFIVVNIHNIY